jgi:hypothetical protein
MSNFDRLIRGTEIPMAVDSFGCDIEVRTRRFGALVRGAAAGPRENDPRFARVAFRIDAERR